MRRSCGRIGSRRSSALHRIARHTGGHVLSEPRHVDPLTVLEWGRQIHPIDVYIIGDAASGLDRIGDTSTDRKTQETRSAHRSEHVHRHPGRRRRGGDRRIEQHRGRRRFRSGPTPSRGREQDEPHHEDHSDDRCAGDENGAIAEPGSQLLDGFGDPLDHRDSSRCGRGRDDARGSRSRLRAPRLAVMGRTDRSRRCTTQWRSRSAGAAQKSVEVSRRRSPAVRGSSGPSSSSRSRNSRRASSSPFTIMRSASSRSMIDSSVA